MDEDGDIGKVVALDYRLAPRPQPVPMVGLLALAEDASIEHELRACLPAVELLCARVPCAARIDTGSLAAMAGELDAAMARLVPSTALDAIAYGCTSGAMVMGEARVAAAVARHRPGTPVATPLGAARAWLDHHRLRRPLILFPYERALATQMARALCAGRERRPAALGSFLCPLDPQVARIDVASLLAAVEQLWPGAGADGIFIGCTALRSAAAAAILARRHGCPVSSSNLALGWQLARWLGDRAAVG